ncbi:MAG: ABC transporter ATP-binding protein [Actinobacteria bacterium]|nr:ABC transporter ATP-binding protein [Actinomycetota bacterium]
MITIRNVTKRYGKTEVVKNFSLEVAPGESIAMWGPNGAGKTTVVRCILGLVAYEGTITVGGLDARRYGKSVRKAMGYVPQELSFYDEMTVYELLDYAAALRGISQDRVDHLCEVVVLTEHVNKQVRELSGGLKQRLGIASALLPDPPILLLDEPTSNLDAQARDAALELLQGLRDDGRTLIVTSHHVEEIAMLVDRVVAMEHGEITVICDPSDLAEELGLRAWLHLILENGSAEHALQVLTDLGFPTKLNSRGVLVEVSAQGKGEAVAALQRAGVEIKDLEIWR